METIDENSEHSDEFFSCGEAEDEEKFEVCGAENEYLDEDLKSSSDESECVQEEDEETQEENEEEEEEEDEDDDEDGEEGSDQANDEEEDDDSGWVTPSNFAHLRRNINGGDTEEKEITVGCMSTDFSVQVSMLPLIGFQIFFPFFLLLFVSLLLSCRMC